MPDVDRAVARIVSAVRNGEDIVVYGDFDADGVTAAAVMVKGLERIGGRVRPYIPHRVDEGHGLNRPALEGLSAQGVKLVISVDCGITGHEEVEEALRMGLDVIITDHHEVAGPVPRALAVVNPKLPDSKYPFRDLAGVGVAYKLVEALFRATDRTGQQEDLLDLVAVGTVADLVPLMGENRYLVNRGLMVLNRTERLGIRAMIGRAGLDLAGIDAETISFALAPRLNAAGRLDHASISYDVLVTGSGDEAGRLANLLDLRNAERQSLTREYTALAEERLGPEGLSAPLLIVADGEFHAGVNGVVAGKLADRYYRPAIVIEVGDRESNGSARSIPEFNMFAALAECADLFLHFGGHEQAAGFSVANENLDGLKSRLLVIAERELAGMDLQPTITIDAEVSLSSLRQGTLNLIRRLEPCGKGNSAPVFVSRGVRVLNAREVGSDGEHLKMKLGDRGQIWDAIGFGLNHRNGEMPPLIDIVYNLKLNVWRGQESLQIGLLDFVPSM